MKSILRRISMKSGISFTPREDAICRQLSAQVDIDGRYRRIYHYHVRKTGGTSINQMFLGLGGLPGSEVYAGLSRSLNLRQVVGDKVFVGWNRRLIEQGNYYYAFSHAPLHELTLPVATFTLTCIREPISRLLSHYNMLLDYQEAGVARADLRAEMNWLGSSFADFVTNMPRRHLQRQLYMFSAAYDPAEALDRIMNCSCLLFTHTLAEDVNKLAQQLKLDLHLAHTRRSSKKWAPSPGDIDLARIALEPELRLYEALQQQTSARSAGES